MCGCDSVMGPESGAALRPYVWRHARQALSCAREMQAGSHQGSHALAGVPSRNRLTLQLGTRTCAALACAAEALPIAVCTARMMVQQPKVACMWVQWVYGSCVTDKSGCLKQVLPTGRHTSWKQPFAELVETHLVSLLACKEGADGQLPLPPQLGRLQPEQTGKRPSPAQVRDLHLACSAIAPEKGFSISC
jgi:hypothetical protein